MTDPTAEPGTVATPAPAPTPATPTQVVTPATDEEKRIQSQVDSRLATAMATREKNVRDEVEKEFEAKIAETEAETKRRTLESEGEYKKLYEDLQSERDVAKAEAAHAAMSASTTKTMADAGLSDLTAIFDHDHSTTEGRTAAIGVLAEHFNTAVDKAVATRASTPRPPGSQTIPPTGDIQAQANAAAREGNLGGATDMVLSQTLTRK